MYSLLRLFPRRISNENNTNQRCRCGSTVNRRRSNPVEYERNSSVLFCVASPVGGREGKKEAMAMRRSGSDIIMSPQAEIS